MTRYDYKMINMQQMNLFIQKNNFARGLNVPADTNV